MSADHVGPASHGGAPTFGMVLRRAPGYRGMDVFFSGLLDGIDAALRSADAHVELVIVATLAEELDALRRWAERGLVDGVVIADMAEDDPRPALCRELGLPAVSLGVGAEPGVSGIVVDNAAATRLAVDFLADLGHRRLARVGGPARLIHTRQRDEAFAARAEELGLAPYHREGSYGRASGHAATRELLALTPRPTAILFDNDDMAVAGLDAAREVGLRVPRDLSILAWDDSPLSRLASPPLSVVSRDVHELGATVGGALLASARGEVVELRHGPDAHVIARGSTATAPTD